MTDPDLSEKIIQTRKVSEKIGNTVVITCCPSCREQLLGAGMKTIDIVQLLDEALRGGQ